MKKPKLTMREMMKKLKINLCYVYFNRRKIFREVINYMKEITFRGKKLLAFVLMFAVLFGQFMPFMPGQTAYAAQQNSYHDPAEHWSAML